MATLYNTVRIAKPLPNIVILASKSIYAFLCRSGYPTIFTGAGINTGEYQYLSFDAVARNFFL